MSKHSERGFTIIELMIATTVLSVILLLVAAVLTGIGSIYYKGVSQSRSQQNLRSILDDITQQLQYTDAEPIYDVSTTFPDESVLCVGTTRYTFYKDLDKQIGSDPAKGQSPHILWRQTNVNPITCRNAPDLRNIVDIPGSPGTEMIGPNMSLTQLSLDTTNTPYYSLKVGVAYGDRDLLQIVDEGGVPKTQCKGSKANGSGNQYCSSATIGTSVIKRVR